ncbi:outer membrane protein assembly factor BamA [Flocculibacter collagenilyticus]|uniref:outer membrane protein assembly factor BamA n=1 Tax=Flocculibacter collagenilyticus TaxID=2744479 RepID=UPI0018F3D1A5|nr:outer membrane protein assembly factor BamA [Flocculibacter collagenilyticus]
MALKNLLIASTLVGASIAATTPVHAEERFVVDDLAVNGLQRVTLGAALTYIPFSIGDEVSDFTVSQTVKALYLSGHFDDIEVYKDGNKVIFEVTERPTISDITFEGNDDIKDEQLQDSLKNNNIVVGEPLDKTLLTGIENGLIDFFHGVGKYNAKVEAVVTYLPRNRVRLQLEFEEGEAASVRQINIVGNELFSDEELLKNIESQQDLPWWKFFSSDRYQKQALQGDLETIRSHYLDRGYLRFNVESNQVSVSPDKESVYVTFNVSEGEQYTVKGYDFIGDLLGKEDFVKKFIPIKTDELYNGALVTHTEEMISNYLSSFGYANSEVRTIPEIDDEKKEVHLTISVNPGKRIYVRRIDFVGNEATADEVLRREVRQMEGAWLSNNSLDLSKNYLQRLKYLEKIEYETHPVPGEDDLVDVVFDVKEQPSGSFQAGVSYGSYSKLAFQAGIQHDNFLGTGNRVGINLNTYSAAQNISLSYTDPYFTMDGISLGGNIFYSNFDAGSAQLVRYKNKSYGIGLTTSFPIFEFNRLQFGATFKSNEVSQLQEYEQIKNYIALYSDPNDPDGGLEFDNIELFAGWSRSTLNRGLFPTAGSNQSLSMVVSTPNSDNKFFKLNFDSRFYFPLTNDHSWSLLTRLKMGYGNGYGEKNGIELTLPFSENFRLGGKEVRGFENNIIGPRAVYLSPTEIGGGGDPINGGGVIGVGNDFDSIGVSLRSTGGNAMVHTGLELIFPTPFLSEDFTNSVRTSLFVDVGNVWDTEFDLNRFSHLSQTEQDKLSDYSDPGLYRASAGLSIQWISPMGPMAFSFAKTLKEQTGDETEVFSFNIGTTF